MFVFAFEGELLAFIVNGDRFVLFALLPRRKPRTSVSAAALSFQRTQPHHRTGTPIPLCALVGGMDFCFNDVAPHLHTMRAKCRLGFTRQKKRSSPSLEMTSIFRFSAPTALRRYECLRFRSAGAASRAVFVFGPHIVRAGLRFLFRYATTGAEAEVRVRARGRADSDHRQRRQVRVARAATTAKTAHRLLATTSSRASEPVVLTYISM